MCVSQLGPNLAAGSRSTKTVTICRERFRFNKLSRGDAADERNSGEILSLEFDTTGMQAGPLHNYTSPNVSLG